MFRHRKKHQKNKSHSSSFATTNNYTPFSMYDTTYLKHLHEHVKLRNTFEGSKLLQEEIKQSNNRINYKNELEIIKEALEKDHGQLGHLTVDRLKKREEELQKLIKM